MSYQNYMQEYNKIGYSADGITHIKSFMSKDDAGKAVEYLKSHDSVGNIYQNEISDASLIQIMQSYERKVFEEIKANYIDKYGVVVKPEAHVPVHFTKWDMLVGESMSMHSDSETPSREPALAGGFYRYNITSIVYLSSDFSGGEIMFPEFDIKIKPSPGDLLLFPSRYKHAIAHFDSGTRYTMPAWFTFDVEDTFSKEETASYTHRNPSDILFFEDND